MQLNFFPPEKSSQSHLAVWLLALIAFGMLFLRAWPRLFYPDVWDEDGINNLYGFLSRGWIDMLTPVSGYIIAVPKTMTYLSASISITYYPLLSTILTWIFTVFIFVTIAKAPTYLKGGIWLAVFCALLPTNPEVFGLPLYSFWWASLLLPLLVFWDEKKSHFGFRIFLLCIASMSSPFCVATLPLLLIRAYVLRKLRVEIILAVLALIMTVTQFWIMYPQTSSFVVALLYKILPRFLGGYTVVNLYPALAWIGAFALLIYALAGILRNRQSWVLWTLGYLVVISIIMSVIRTHINDLDQSVGGPRYFFFPYIFISWYLLQLVYQDRAKWFRLIGIGFLGLSLINMIPVLGRNHDSLYWKSHVYSCAQFDKYELPAHFAGSAGDIWPFPIDGALCATWLQKDPFASEPKSTYPYRVLRKIKPEDYANFDIAKASQVKQSEWQGQDYETVKSGKLSVPAGYRIIGSYTGKPNTTPNSVTVHLRRGQQILYRTESNSGNQQVTIAGHESQFISRALVAPKWMIYDFSNRQLPDEFDVIFTDQTGPGEWSAIAVKE